MKSRFKLLASLFLGLLGLAALQWLFGLGAFGGTNHLSPTLGSDLDLLFEVALKVENLPPGWYREQGSIETETVPGGEGRFLWFYNTSARGQSWVNIGEVVRVYPDEPAAEEGWLEQRDKYFPPGAEGWEERPELSFAYRADEVRVACLEAYVNGYHHYACRAVARYGRVVIVVLGNVFDDRWLTMNEFREVLEAADRRAAEAVRAERSPYRSE